MKTIKLSSASRSLAEYALELDGDIMVVTDGGTAIAAIVPLKGVDRESIALSSHPEFMDLIARSRAEFVAGDTLSFKQMKKAVLTPRKASKRSDRIAVRRCRSSA